MAGYYITAVCSKGRRRSDTVNRYIKISDIGVSMSPPDETHTVLDYQGVSVCIPLVDATRDCGGNRTYLLAASLGVRQALLREVQTAK